MYLVTGATGQVGGAVVRALSDREEPVRVFVRSRAKGAPLARAGAEVAVGTFDDVVSLADAMRDVRACFLMQPNDFASTDFLGDGERRARRFREALERAGHPPMVGLSSVGAHREDVVGVARRERRFEQAFMDYRSSHFVRGAFFIENWANVLEAVRGPGVLPTFLRPDVREPMVSVDDLGAEIAARLVSPVDSRVTELAGPADHSPEDVARSFAGVLGRPVRVSAAPPAAAVDAFMELGFSRPIAELVGEMYEGYASGRMRFAAEPRRGTTTLDAAVARLVGAGG